MLDEGAHWHYLANTIEPSVCSGNAALCQITLTTCLKLSKRILLFVNLLTIINISDTFTDRVNNRGYL